MLLLIFAMPSLLEVLFIFAIVLLFWGPARLGGLGKGFGEGIRNFRKSLRGDAPPPPPDSDQNQPKS
jgi:Sec-independent protein translocase protein TatA